MDIDMPDYADIGNVVALTLVDASTLCKGRIGPDTLVRIGVRRNDTNTTHPDIVSVPTQRMPAALAKALLNGEPDEWIEEELHQLPIAWVDNESLSGHDPVIYSVESLMCMKLGVSEPLERDEITFVASPALLTISHAHYPNLIEVPDAPYPSDELLRMINLRVHVESGCNLFPETTASYEHCRWVTARDFQSMMDGKDVSAVGLDGFKFCVDGLCVATTSQLLKQELDFLAA